MSDLVLADACGEVPLPRVVLYNIERHARIGGLQRFAGYFRQLGFTAAEHQALAGAGAAQRQAVVERVAQRTGWGERPDEHLVRSGCRLLTVVGEDVPPDFGVTPPDPLWVLEQYASLRAPVKLFVGVDPQARGSLERALELVGHPQAAGLALSPYLAGLPLDDEAFAPVLDAALERALPLWVHTCAHFRTDVPYDIEHPRHADRVLLTRPGLRLMLGHAGWPWTADACVVALRHPGTLLEFATFPPAVLRDPGWSLTALWSQRAALRGRICFGSGATSEPGRFARLVEQLDALGLGEDLPAWRGQALLDWLGEAAGPGERGAAGDAAPVA